MREVTTREGAQIQIKIDYPFRTFAKECLGEVLGKFIDFFPLSCNEKNLLTGVVLIFKIGPKSAVKGYGMYLECITNFQRYVLETSQPCLP